MKYACILYNLKMILHNLYFFILQFNNWIKKKCFVQKWKKKHLFVFTCAFVLLITKLIYNCLLIKHSTLYDMIVQWPSYSKTKQRILNVLWREKRISLASGKWRKRGIYMIDIPSCIHMSKWLISALRLINCYYYF